MNWFILYKNIYIYFYFVSILIIYFYLYDGRLASISLVFWVVVPLSEESCESSLSEPWGW